SGGGAQAQLVVEQPRDAAHGGEAQAEPAAAIARWIVELVELLEDALVLLGWNAYAAVPYLYACDAPALAPRDDDAAALRVTQCGRDQVRQHAEQQRRVRHQHRVRATYRQLQSLVLRGHGERGAQAIEDRIDRDDLALHLDLARVEPRDVEQIVEELL